MKKLIITSALFAASFLSFAQNKIKLDPFNKIVINLPISIELINSNEPMASAGDTEGKIEFNVKDNTLYIDNNKMPNFKNAIQVYFTDLKAIKIDGAGTIKTINGSIIKTDVLEINADGIAKLELDVKTTDLKIKSDGASSIVLNGSTDNLSAKIDGALSLNAKNLKTKSSNIKADGACKFSVHASEKLEIAANGIVKGTYYGNPINRLFKVDGLSKITDAESGKVLSDERQGLSTDGDTTRLKFGGKKIIIIEDEKEEKHASKSNKNKRKELKNVYSGFELGMQSFADNSFSLNLPADYSFLNTQASKSWFFGLNLLEGDAQIIKNKLAITSGLGLEFFNMGFDNNRKLEPNTKAINADSNNLALTRNRLYNFNFNVPLLIKFAPNGGKKKDNGFHVAAGVIGTYVAHSHLRTISTAKGYEEDTKTFDDFNINPFRLTATVRVGYGWFRAFANYSLTPYFKSSNTGLDGSAGPDIRVASVGLTLIPF